MADQVAGDGAQGQVSGQLAVQKVYVKDLSFEAPHAPQVFTQEWKPTVDLQLGTSATALGEGLHEVVVHVTVTVRFEEQVAYLAEAQQAGVFAVRGFGDEHLPVLLATVCPNILFPFARETIADLVSRGGFPQLLLAPVNFEQLYAEQLRRQQGAGDDEAAAH